MRTVQIIQGTYAYRVNGMLEPKDRFSAPFPVGDAEAERIVSLGIAKYADKGVATGSGSVAQEISGGNPTEKEDAQELEYEAQDKPEYSIENTVADLRKIAKENGISLKVGMTKEEMVAALDAHFEEDAPVLEASSLIDEF